jgi:hypothetical protein
MRWMASGPMVASGLGEATSGTRCGSVACSRGFQSSPRPDHVATARLCSLGPKTWPNQRALLPMGYPRAANDRLLLYLRAFRL